MGSKKAEMVVTAPMMRALPCIYDWFKALELWPELLERLQQELNDSERAGSVAAARAFLGITVILAKLGPQVKAFQNLFDEMKKVRVPAALGRDGVSHVPLDEGYRVGTSDTMYVSVQPGKVHEAMAWLRESNLERAEGGALADLITETINASSLSAAGRFMLQEHCIDLPSDLFKSYFQTTTSLTKTAKR